MASVLLLFFVNLFRICEGNPLLFAIAAKQSQNLTSTNESTIDVEGFESLLRIVLVGFHKTKRYKKNLP